MSGRPLAHTRSGKNFRKGFCVSCGAGMWDLKKKKIAVEVLPAGGRVCVSLLYCHSSLEICSAYLRRGWSGWQDYMVVWSDCEVSFGKMSSLPLVHLNGEWTGNWIESVDWCASGFVKVPLFADNANLAHVWVRLGTAFSDTSAKSILLKLFKRCQNMEFF